MGNLGDYNTLEKMSNEVIDLFNLKADGKYVMPESMRARLVIILKRYLAI